MTTNDKLIYLILCGLRNVLGFYPGKDITESKALYPSVYSLAAGTANANETALVAAIAADIQAGLLTAIQLPAEQLIATADATDLPEALVLLNEIKGKWNARITAMQSAGLMAS